MSDALEQLLAIFLDGLVANTVKIEKSVRKEMFDRYISQPVFIQMIFHRNMMDARMMLNSHTLGEMSTVAQLGA